MKIPENKTTIEMVSCDICMKEIPRSEGKSIEAQDYVMNFCGLDCYEKWLKQKEQKTEENAQL